MSKRSQRIARRPEHDRATLDRRQLLHALSATCLAGIVERATASPQLNPPACPTPGREVPYLDAHVHLSSPQMMATLERKMGSIPRLAVRDTAGLIERLDREGIRHAWVLSEAYLMASDMMQLADPGEERSLVQAENDFVGEQAVRLPNRLNAFISLNPKRDYAEDEIERCVEAHRPSGLKLHCWNSLVDVRDTGDLDRLRSVLSHAADKGLPVVVHAFNGSVRGYGPKDIEIWARELIQPLPKLRLCFAHLGGAGGFGPPMQAVLEALIDHLGPSSTAAGRVFVDLSAVLVGENTLGLPPTPPEERQRMAELLAAWGCDRVLWGSDSIPGYLELSRAAWPLSQGQWSTLCSARGESFLGGSRPGIRS
ncbi:MAG: amidohydrolase family protein [Acidobacteriota bacterium]